MFFSIKFLIFVCITSVASAAEYNYYWREYAGNIPLDAVVAGTDINGDNVYIGQAYIHGYGLLPVQIKPNVRKVQAAIFGVVTVDKHIKILCGRQENFYWLRTTAANLASTINGKHVIVGGWDHRGIYYIGRVTIESETLIGGVAAFITTDPRLWMVYKNTPPGVQLYEVLMFKETDPDNILTYK